MIILRRKDVFINISQKLLAFYINKNIKIIYNEKNKNKQKNYYD